MNEKEVEKFIFDVSVEISVLRKKILTLEKENTCRCGHRKSEHLAVFSAFNPDAQKCSECYCRKYDGVVFSTDELEKKADYHKRMMKVIGGEKE